MIFVRIRSVFIPTGPALGVRVVLTHRALEALGPNPRYVSYRVVSS